MDLPDLIEIQKKSYQWFFDEGLTELFEEVSPIRDFTNRELELWLGAYTLDEPKFDEVTSRAKNITYEAALRVRATLVNIRTTERKEQEIYLGDFPLMTERGTFIVNGIERVVVSQLIRSAGAFFTSEFVRTRKWYGAKVIPNRGAWLEFETDANKVIWVRIDRKRKIAMSGLLRAFGFGTEEEIYKLFNDLKHINGTPFTVAEQAEALDYVRATLGKDTTKSEAEGLKEVYKRIRPGDLATVDNARSLIQSMFFRFDRYDFGRVGRYKLNQRFGFDIPNTKETRILRREDVTAILRRIIELNVTQMPEDDIDHLGNRRVRAVGELVQNKFRVGLARMERIVRDRMSTMDVATMSPSRLINARPVMSAVKEFFMSSQLSQFMDQTNPLSELEHKRRLSAMGPGGLSRERAGFDVRDVHQTHYGRICPIATPEGPNIGLVGHLASYARVNDYGFIETPFLQVKKDSSGKAKVSTEVAYIDAFEEEKRISTAATTPVDDKGRFMDERSEVRKNLRPGVEFSDNIQLMDVSAKQIVSIATALIPFLEHDDAIRALMGTNMQRQAVSVIKPQAPIIGTGVEKDVAKYSGHLIMAEENGVVIGSDGRKITVDYDKMGEKSYQIQKFVRSNASTCMNQIVKVEPGMKVKKGDVLADGPAMDGGELALGQNLLVAFMPWKGSNFEDAIIISERLVQMDRYTSIHIEDYSIDVRDTKLGPEEVTGDIPNIGEEKLKDLDEEGVVRIGAEVSSGDILVGKITPKGETELSAEEKLIRVIFGEKAKDVRDSSMYLEHGEHGKVVDIKIFSREQGDKLSSGIIKTIQVSVASLRKVQVGDKMAGRHGNKGVISTIVPVEDMPFLPDGQPVDILLSPLGVVSRMNLGQILETHLGIAAHRLGYKVATPVLDGVSDIAISEELVKSGWSADGKTALYDGRTGDAFDNQVTVGMVYMLKLNHLVEDKIHQRSIGPYSLITQQPLGGKAQFGGQRFGEMEVWALEGYGAAHMLQEILTIKSDDVPGRSRAYESIIKGEAIHKLNVPESFHVLVRELKGLCLDVELLKDGKRISEGSQYREEERPKRIGVISDSNTPQQD